MGTVTSPSPLYVSSPFFSLVTKTLVGFGAHPDSGRPHLEILSKSAKTLYPNKVTPPSHGGQDPAISLTTAGQPQPHSPLTLLIPFPVPPSPFLTESLGDAPKCPRFLGSVP